MGHPKTLAEINLLAQDLYKGAIFTDRHISKRDFPHMAGSIFMPLGLMDTEQMKEFMAGEPDMIFEYLDKQGHGVSTVTPCSCLFSF